MNSILKIAVAFGLTLCLPGCLILPPAFTLVAKPLTFLASQSNFTEQVDGRQPISVEQLLAEARGPSFQTPSGLAEAEAEDTSDDQTGAEPISVDELLANARASAGGVDQAAGQTATPPVGALPVNANLTDVLNDTPALLKLRSGLLDQFPPGQKYSFSVGTRVEGGKQSLMFAQFSMARELCAMLAPQCDPAHLSVSPNHAVGQVSFFKSGDNT